MCAQRGQGVLDLWWDGGIDGASEESIGLEGLEGLGEHLFADAADDAGELREPVGAVEQNEEDEGSPAGGDMVEDDAGGAVGIIDIATATTLTGGQDS